MVLAVACGGETDTSEKRVVENISQTLKNQAAVEANEIPEAKAGDIETGATSWESSFTETQVISRDGVTTRKFRLTLRNRAENPQKFRATVQYLDADGAEVRTKEVPVTVVEPFSDRSIDSELALPDRAAQRIVRALPDVEALPWEEETPTPSPSP